MKRADLGSASWRGSPAVALRPAPASGAAVHAPLAGLAGTDLARRFRYWRGVSGRRYLFSVFPLGPRRCADRSTLFESAVILAVAHRQDDQRRILCVEETGPRPDRFFESGRWKDAVAAGANEIHVHLLTENFAARTAMVRDFQS